MNYKVGDIVIFKTFNECKKVENIQNILYSMEKYLGEKHRITYLFFGHSNKKLFFCVEDNKFLWDENIIKENKQMEFDFK